MTEKACEWDNEVCEWCPHPAHEHRPHRPDGSMPCSKCECPAYCLPLSYFAEKKPT